MGPKWVLTAPHRLHIGPMNLAIRDNNIYCSNAISVIAGWHLWLRIDINVKTTWNDLSVLEFYTIWAVTVLYISDQYRCDDILLRCISDTPKVRTRKAHKVPTPYMAQQLVDDAIKWKHFTRYWPLVRGIHRSPMNSPKKSQWPGALVFSLICAWINGWVNNCEAGDLRRHRAHYDVIVMVVSVTPYAQIWVTNAIFCFTSLSSYIIQIH